MKASTIILTGLTVLSLGLSGCAHSVMRGTVAMKTSENEAHVCMNKDEVKPGDRVSLFRNVCTGKGGGGERSGGGGRSCEKREIGKGTVKENINEHYALVQFDSGVQFEEGTFVEKL